MIVVCVDVNSTIGWASTVMALGGSTDACGGFAACAAAAAGIASAATTSAVRMSA